MEVLFMQIKVSESFLTVFYLHYLPHSKLGPIFPTPKVQKNCSRHVIKTGGSLTCTKVREAKKMGSCLKSKGFNGPKPTWVNDNKILRGWIETQIRAKK